MPFLDLIPAGIAEENMVKILREKYDKDRTGLNGRRRWFFGSFVHENLDATEFGCPYSIL